MTFESDAAEHPEAAVQTSDAGRVHATSAGAPRFPSQRRETQVGKLVGYELTGTEQATKLSGTDLHPTDLQTIEQQRRKGQQEGNRAILAQVLYSALRH